MKVDTYLLFNGKCEAAMKFYEKCLNGKITNMLTYEGSPAAEHVPASLAKQILHASLNLGDFNILASDCPPDKYDKPQGFAVTLQISDFAKAESTFNVLADGGKIIMPFGKTFWAKGYGQLEDKFGIPWMVNCT